MVIIRLTGIREPDQLRTHPLRGALFESWVAGELVKRGAHQGIRRELHHYRDAAGLEVDLVSTDASSVTLIESKSGATIASDFAGTTRQTRGLTQLVPWHEIDSLTWTDTDGLT